MFRFTSAPYRPMLLNIKTGCRGVTQRPQNDIIYICCRLEDITNVCKDWCFTNGHAKDSLAEFFNDLNDLDKVYWDAVYLKYWHPIEEFLDRQVRKQAEFLVKAHVPVKCIASIIVYGEESYNFVQRVIEALELSIPIFINPDNKFYY